GRGMSNFQIGRKLVDRFVNEYGGVTCEALQQRFTGRTWDMWNPVEYKTFSDARGEQCARATGLVTRWVVESLSGG
ncbi:MAG: C-GCAxxG-C-C family protein, partial [Pseudomonadales bacterium]|nr:C-GCAxxG-C-C family protein [Pseudomonadales bacterium]